MALSVSPSGPGGGVGVKNLHRDLNAARLRARMMLSTLSSLCSCRARVSALFSALLHLSAVPDAAPAMEGDEEGR